MVYFQNKDITWLNIHHAFFIFAYEVAWVFGPLYFYSIGFPVFKVFLIYATMLVCRLPARCLIMPIIFKHGLAFANKISLIGMMISFLILAFVEQYGFLLWVYIPFYACVSSWYWLTFHTLYAKLGEAENRGRHMSVRVMLTLAVGFLGPIINGALIYYVGFWVSFLIAGISVFVAFLSLNKVRVRPSIEKVSWRSVWKKLSKTGIWLFFWGSFATYPHFFVWQFVLFFLLGNALSFGALMGVLVLFQVLAQFFIGKWIDSDKGEKLVHISSGAGLGVLLAKILFGFKIPIILLIQGGESFIKLIRDGVDAAIFYNDGKRSVHPLWYQFFSEMAWDLGAAFSLVSCSVFIYGGGELRNAMYFAIPGILGVWWVSWRFFKKAKS